MWNNIIYVLNSRSSVNYWLTSREAKGKFPVCQDTKWFWENGVLFSVFLDIPEEVTSNIWSVGSAVYSGTYENHADIMYKWFASLMWLGLSLLKFMIKFKLVLIKKVYTCGHISNLHTARNMGLNCRNFLAYVINGSLEEPSTCTPKNAEATTSMEYPEKQLKRETDKKISYKFKVCIGTKCPYLNPCNCQSGMEDFVTLGERTPCWFTLYLVDAYRHCQ